jgi:hypothetical protein
MTTITVAAMLTGCAYPSRIPEPLRASKERPLLTVKEAAIVTCAVNRTIKDVWTYGDITKKVCLARGPGGPLSEVKATIPVGSAVRVRRATSWSGGAAVGYVYDAIVPAYSETQVVYIESSSTMWLFGVDTEPRNIYDKRPAP